MKRFYYFNFLTFLFFICNSVLAQRPYLQFEQITEKSGRSLGPILGLTQDKEGFLWISTKNSGLLRYDGYSYKTFKYNPSDSTSLPFNGFSIFYDADGILWLKKYDRLASFINEKNDKRFGSFTGKNFNDIAKLIGDSENNIWIAQSGRMVNRFNKTTSKIDTFTASIPKYSPEVYKIIDSLDKSQNKFVELSEITNNKDTTKLFSVSEPCEVLIACVGEMDNTSAYDYGFIMSGNETVWKMDYQNSKSAGGTGNFRVQLKIINLAKGKYKLRYISDNQNAWGHWETSNPPETNFYGIKIFKITANEKVKIEHAAKIQNSFKSISSNKVYDMILDHSNDVVLVTDKGIDKYLPAKNTFEQIPVDYNGLLNVKNDVHIDIICLFQDRQLNYWIGTRNGLICFNLKNNSFKVFQNKTSKDSILSDNFIYTIYEDNADNIWVGTHNGLDLMEAGKNSFFHYKADTRNRLYDNQIMQIFEDKSDNLWIATNEGLNRLLKSKFKFYSYNNEFYKKFSICHDSKNSFWFAGKQNSLINYVRNTYTYNKYEIDKKYFADDNNKPEYVYNDIFDDSDKNLWIAINNKLISFDKKSGTNEKRLSLPSIVLSIAELDNKIFAIRQSADNNLLIFSLDGIRKFSSITNQVISHIKTPVPDKVVFKPDVIKYILNSKDKNFWIRTFEGIFLYNNQQNKLDKIYEFSKEDQESSLVDGNLAEDKDGNIWFALMPRVYKINKNKKIESFLIEEINLDAVTNNDLLIDNNSQVWVYTNIGCFILNNKTGKFDKYTYREGLADNYINGMVDDRKGNVWLTSKNGLSKIDLEDRLINTFFGPTDFSSYNFIGAMDYPANHEIMFLATNGFLSYFPDSINKKPPQVVITRFTLFGKEYDLDSLIYLKKHIILPYNLNFLAFEFAALDFTDPAKNQYKFILEGLDNEWTITDANNRRATYTSLPDGDYTLRIIASNNDKQWNEKGVAIKITIEPPIWKRWWFRILSVIAIFLAIYLFIRQRERNLIRDKRILEQKVIERTAEIQAQKEEILAQRDLIEEQKSEVEKQRDIANNQRDQIGEQKKAIMDSIFYARRIQTAILPPQDMLQQILPNHFILYRPRDIVSGDFYWATQRENKIIVTAADCTGHGVPGAFMSMLGIALLSEIVNKREILSAGEILTNLKANIIRSLHQTGKDNEAKDGMDISLCVIDKESRELQWAGAFNSLWLLRKTVPEFEKLTPEPMVDGDFELHEIKPDRMPIGIFLRSKDNFTNNIIHFKSHDTIYLFSDGYEDQFGGEQGRKFMSRNFKRLLLSVQNVDLNSQKEILAKTIDDWQKGYEQVDDILVIGIRFD